ncbi:MAG TPA: hypothetical protein VMB48_02820 [Steroidobacteraceae bacterium]|nr:hypothetical protein [Steroidobacteraceae bacterium]
MNTFSIFSPKVLLCAVAAFIPTVLLYTGFEATTQQVVEQAQNQIRAEYRVLAAAPADSIARGVVVG